MPGAGHAVVQCVYGPSGNWPRPVLAVLGGMGAPRPDDRPDCLPHRRGCVTVGPGDPADLGHRARSRPLSSGSGSGASPAPGSPTPSWRSRRVPRGTVLVRRRGGGTPGTAPPLRPPVLVVVIGCGYLLVRRLTSPGWCQLLLGGGGALALYLLSPELAAGRAGPRSYPVGRAREGPGSRVPAATGAPADVTAGASIGGRRRAPSAVACRQRSALLPACCPVSVHGVNAGAKSSPSGC